MIEYREISPKEWNDLKKQGYLSKGSDGITRALFHNKATGGTILAPVRKTLYGKK
jgi:hypothetical protein